MGLVLNRHPLLHQAAVEVEAQVGAPIGRFTVVVALAGQVLVAQVLAVAEEAEAEVGAEHPARLCQTSSSVGFGKPGGLF